MTRPSRILSAGLITLAAPMVSEAQTCLGLASFSTGRVQIGASGEFGNEAEAYSGNIAIGSTHGAFGGVSFGSLSHQGFSENTTLLGASFGWQIPVGRGSRAQVCPGVGAALGLGPETIGGSVVNLSSHSAFAGLQVGVSAGEQFRMIPTAGAGLVYSKVDWEDVGYFSGEDRTDVYGLISLGVGLVASRLSLRPSVDIPLGLDNADPSFGITVALNLGRRS